MISQQRTKNEILAILHPCTLCSYHMNWVLKSFSYHNPSVPPPRLKKTVCFESQNIVFYILIFNLHFYLKYLQKHPLLPKSSFRLVVGFKIK